jgi:hypothetical protein
MVSATQGTPVYKAGAAFTYTPAGGLTGGSHTYHFEASDGAGTHTIVSRNVVKRAGLEAERVDLFFPSDGERLSGPLTVSRPPSPFRVIGRSRRAPGLRASGSGRFSVRATSSGVARDTMR